MQTPEEFTLDLYEPMWRGHLTAADLIRARDAEVAEAVSAENARLREGILRVLRETSDDFTAEDLNDLLNPPTEGETDEPA